MTTMTRQELKEEIAGRKIMVLTEDVMNPTPDRRTRHDWTKRPMWKAGTKFAVETFDVGRRYGDGPNGKMAIKIAMAAKPFGQSVNENDSAFDLILDKLEEAPKTVKIVLAAAGERCQSDVCTSIFEWLVEKGEVTVSQFETWVEEYLASNLDDE
jgi:hypothetical protein